MRGRPRPRVAPYAFLAPALGLFAAFMVYPIVASFWTSLTRTTGTGQERFAGLDNYRRLIEDPLFRTALGNTFLFLVLQVPIMLTIALALAVLLNSGLARLRGLLRVSYFLPAVTSLVASAIIFFVLLNRDIGLVNWLLGRIGVDPVPWLLDSWWAKVSVMLVMTWRWTGYNMVIYLAGLQSIPAELYEAAAVDGAGPWRRFRSVTLPNLKPTILVTTVLSTIGVLQLFDEPYTLTDGGPNNATLTLVQYLYRNGFQHFDFGYASAIAYVMVIITAVLGYLQIRLLRGRDET